MLSRMTLRLHSRALSKTCYIAEIHAPDRCLHLPAKFGNRGLKKTSLLSSTKHTPVLAAAFVRYASTGTKEIAETVLPNIPEPPIPPPPEVLDLIEPAAGSLQALGLGGYSPIGLVQNSLEWLHLTLDLPWWGAICVGTICVRLLLFPLIIKAQRNAARMHNELPGMMKIQTQLSEARQAGNDLEVARYSQQLVQFMQTKGVNPIKNMVVPLAQAPFFVSFFLGLRGMANAPVASMKEGGLWWFTDLTVCDPYYALPLLTCGTMFLVIKLGVDGAKLDDMHVGMMRHAIKILPVVMFPFIMSFPSAVVCYWMSTNTISLIQGAVLKIPEVRTFFKIPQLINHPKKALGENKGFVAGFKDSWSNMKVANEVQDRGEADRLRFRASGRGPVPRTFKYDPTKQT